MKYLFSIFLLFTCLRVCAQTEDDFLPQVAILAMDSTENVAQEFCKKVISNVPEFKLALVDRENIMYSYYMYDNSKFESIKFEFQFSIDEVLQPDSSSLKVRRVIVQNIYAELGSMTKIYNYIFNTNHTPDKVMAVSRYEKAISYHGQAYNSILLADDYKPGFWILRFYRL